MTFIMTDDFALDVYGHLDRAYEILEDVIIKRRNTKYALSDTMSVAMVKTMSEIIKENIGNDKPLVKKPAKKKAIKSV